MYIFVLGEKKGGEKGNKRQIRGKAHVHYFSWGEEGSRKMGRRGKSPGTLLFLGRRTGEKKGIQREEEKKGETKRAGGMGMKVLLHMVVSQCTFAIVGKGRQP